VAASTSPEPLGTVVSGHGNDGGDRSEGAVSGRIVGTYLHGPALARNPHLADRILEWATGRSLSPLNDADVEALRHERFAVAASGARASRLRRLVGRPG